MNTREVDDLAENFRAQAEKARRARLCEECHHRPSLRDGDPYYCYCACHDVADAAPQLLEALRAMVRRYGVGIDDSNELPQARAALKAAEGE